MILFLITITVYIGVLIFVKPTPSSLKATPLSYREHIKTISASIWTGVLLLLIFLLTTNMTFIQVNEDLYRVLALSNSLEQLAMFPLQPVTHLFIHGSFVHVVANVVGLGLMSVYERRVGAKRYLAVLSVGAVASAPSIFFYSENIMVSGMSGGIFALIAAYFTDDKQLNTKEWFTAILLFLFVVFMLAINSILNNHTSGDLGMKVDHIGHLLGAIGAILYCRIKPQRKSFSN